MHIGLHATFSSISRNQFLQVSASKSPEATRFGACQASGTNKISEKTMPAEM